MSYATIDDLKLRLSDLYQGVYVKLDGTAMDDEASADIASAEAEINGVIGTRYIVPVTSAKALPLLKTWTVTLAEELAWSRSGKGELPKNVASRVENVRKSLRAIADGSMMLPGASQDNVSGGGSIAFVEGENPVFGRENMQGY